MLVNENFYRPTAVLNIQHFIITIIIIIIIIVGKTTLLSLLLLLLLLLPRCSHTWELAPAFGAYG
jgi:hypothetical protein